MKMLGLLTSLIVLQLHNVYAMNNCPRDLDKRLNEKCEGLGGKLNSCWVYKSGDIEYTCKFSNGNIQKFRNEVEVSVGKPVSATSVKGQKK